MPSSNAVPNSADQRSARAISATQKLPVMRDRGVADERAQHEERAMREVDDAHDAEDQRQADAEEEQQRGLRQRVDALRDEEGEEVHQRQCCSSSASPREAVGRRRRSVVVGHLLQAGVISSPGRWRSSRGIGVVKPSFFTTFTM